MTKIISLNTSRLFLTSSQLAIAARLLSIQKHGPRGEKLDVRSSSQPAHDGNGIKEWGELVRLVSVRGTQ